MKKRSWAFALSCLFAVVDPNAAAELAPAHELAGPIRPCGARRVAPSSPVENASEPGLAPRAPQAPAEVENLAGPIRPCGACRVAPSSPVENASEPGLAPRAPQAPVEVEPLAGPIRPCGACRRDGPRGASTPPPPA